MKWPDGRQVTVPAVLAESHSSMSHGLWVCWLGHCRSHNPVHSPTIHMGERIFQSFLCQYGLYPSLGQTAGWVLRYWDWAIGLVERSLQKLRSLPSISIQNGPLAFGVY